MAAEAHQPLPSTTPSNASPADSTVDADAMRLAESLERRRRELGVAPAEPRTLKLRLPDFNLTPEQESAAEAKRKLHEQQEAEREEAARRAEVESRPRRWLAFCDDNDATTYARLKFDDFLFSNDQEYRRRQTAAVEGVREYTGTISARRNAGEGLFLYGPWGTGKDHLAMIALRAAFIGCGLTVQRINGPEWYGRLRDMIDSGDSERDEVSRLSRCDFLLVSDPLPPIGNLSQHQASMLYRVLEKRQVSGWPTIATVNVGGMKDATDRMGGPVVDRLRYKAWVVECDWPSARKPAKVIS